MKHGQGKYTNICSKEPPIFGPYANDKLDGIATKGDETILYKEGMEIDLSDNDKDPKRNDRFGIGFLSCLLWYGALLVYIGYF